MRIITRQILPTVAMNAGGRFVIAWQGEDNQNEGIRATYYESDGSVIREDFVVNEWEDDSQLTPSVVESSPTATRIGNTKKPGPRQQACCGRRKTISRSVRRI